MKYVVGLSPDRGGREALALGVTLARACGGPLRVCTVIPDFWETPSAARIDAEYGAFLRQKAKRTLARAKAKVPADVAAEFTTVAASTARDGLLRAANLAAMFGVPLRLVTVVVRDKQMYPSGTGHDAENIVADTLREQAEQAQAGAIAAWTRPVPLTDVVADGKSWKAALDALDWGDAELLVIGSRSWVPLMRVFLGSNSTKILQNAPLPCLVLPRLGG